VALIPTHLPASRSAIAHLPSMQVFQNGPNRGRDVFIPMDYIIGGQERLGQGWKMLMTALAARAWHLAAVIVRRGCGIRGAHHRRLCADSRAVHVPIGKFKASRSRWPHRRHRLSARCGAALDLCCAQSGASSRVISGIMKLHATERLRIRIDDAMDIHAARPSSTARRIIWAISIARAGRHSQSRAPTPDAHLIVSDRGAIRAHPYLLEE